MWWSLFTITVATWSATTLAAARLILLLNHERHRRHHRIIIITPRQLNPSICLRDDDLNFRSCTTNITTLWHTFKLFSSSIRRHSSHTITSAGILLAHVIFHHTKECQFHGRTGAGREHFQRHDGVREFCCFDRRYDRLFLVHQDDATNTMLFPKERMD